jgi:hypothetical protein
VFEAIEFKQCLICDAGAESALGAKLSSTQGTSDQFGAIWDTHWGFILFPCCASGRAAKFSSASFKRPPGGTSCLALGTGFTRCAAAL